MKSERGPIKRSLLGSSPRTWRELLEVEVRHEGLNRYQIVRGYDIDVVHSKVLTRMAAWDEIWRKAEQRNSVQQAKVDRRKMIEENREAAEQLSHEAQEQMNELTNILTLSLSKKNKLFDWERLKNKSSYSTPQPMKFIIAPVSLLSKPEKPNEENIRYNPVLSFLDKLFPSRRNRILSEAAAALDADMKNWIDEMAKIEMTNEDRRKNYDLSVKENEEAYQARMSEWTKARDKYNLEMAHVNANVELKRKKYLAKDPNEILTFCELVLSNSPFPEYFPNDFEMQFLPEAELLVVDYLLPKVDALPTLKSVKYSATTEEFVEQHISNTVAAQIFDDVCYKISLRVIHELFSSDQANCLRAVNFNGYISSINPATGIEQTVCIMTLQVGKEAFQGINLAQVNPRACFKGLKGVGSAKLSSLAPVAPLININREDRRFTNSYGVVDSLSASEN
ncbi:MAG: hypothetical protein IT350_09805, partial [Deltaproteobacteria bacterium]|nr:hypothetical protein [Deltaproteobacteria bacterium]